jgi:L-fucose isomerase-like protein
MIVNDFFSRQYSTRTSILKNRLIMEQAKQKITAYIKDGLEVVLKKHNKFKWMEMSLEEKAELFCKLYNAKTQKE